MTPVEVSDLDGLDEKLAELHVQNCLSETQIQAVVETMLGGGARSYVQIMTSIIEKNLAAKKEQEGQDARTERESAANDKAGGERPAREAVDMHAASADGYNAKIAEARKEIAANASRETEPLGFTASTAIFAYFAIVVTVICVVVDFFKKPEEPVVVHHEQEAQVEAGTSAVTSSSEHSEEEEAALLVREAKVKDEAKKAEDELEARRQLEVQAKAEEDARVKMLIERVRAEAAALKEAEVQAQAKAEAERKKAEEMARAKAEEEKTRIKDAETKARERMDKLALMSMGDLEKMATTGNTDAMIALAKKHFNGGRGLPGIGTRKSTDMKNAYFWLYIARAKGNMAAKQMMDEVSSVR